MASSIRCDLQACGCPATGALYTMRYISRERRIVFHDNPKAASTTLRAALGIFPVQGVFENGFVMEDFDGPDPDGDDWFRFGFVRNPWDRLLSAWSMFRRRRAPHMAAMFGVSPDQLDFGEFVRRTETVHNHHWEEQWRFVPSDRLDFVGRVETFERDLQRIRARLGLPDSPLPRRNATDHERYPAYYDATTREIVARRWARDIEQFGYAFDQEPATDVRVGDRAAATATTPKGGTP